MRKMILKVEIDFVKETNNYKVYSVRKYKGLAKNFLPERIYLNKDLFEEGQNQEELTLGIF